MILSDNHMHSFFSTDSDEPMEEQVKGAIEKGLKSITFTDHYDIDFPYDEEYKDKPQPIFVFDIEAYLKEIERLKLKYKDRLIIRKGIELGIKEDINDKINKQVNTKDFDFIIHSTHLLFGMDPYYLNFWEGKDVKYTLEQYFLRVLSNLDEWTDYDTVAHLDYIVRYIPEIRNYIKTYDDLSKSAGEGADCNCNLNAHDNDNNHSDYNVTEVFDILKSSNHISLSEINKMRDEVLQKINAYLINIYKDNELTVKKILDKIIDNNKSLEVNTAGFAYKIGHANPHEFVLKMYYEMGGRSITIGADAHSKEKIAFAFDKTEEILKEIGFNGYYIYTGRKSEFIKF